MHTSSILGFLVLSTLALPATSLAQAPAGAQQYVYPSNEQTAQQQQADEVHCGAWAVQQSGYDPAHPQAYAQAHPAPVTGSGARVRGATAGAAVGAIGGNDVGNAAVKGAVVGGVARRSRNRQAATQQNAAAAAQQQSGLAAYQNARNACLDGRGYSVR